MPCAGLGIFWATHFLLKKNKACCLLRPAKRLAPAILKALSEIRKALGEFADFDPLRSHQRFVIAMQESLELGVLPVLLSTLEKQAPNVKIVSTRLHRDTMLADLTNRNLHLVIDIGRAVAAPISHSLLRRDTYKVLMNKQNPLAQNIDKKKYVAARHITVSKPGKRGVGRRNCAAAARYKPSFIMALPKLSRRGRCGG